ncbi:MAG: hypothetical protein ABIP13_03880 [Tepidiformaceae bacterium]
MFSVLNSKLLSIGAASIIAFGVIGVASVALADEPPVAAGRSGSAPGHSKEKAHKLGKLVAGTTLKDAGVTKEELKQAATEGKTVGATITAYGDKSISQVQAAAAAALEARLTAAIAEGKLTSAQAETIRTAAPAAFDKLMAAKVGEHHDDGDDEGEGNGPHHQKLAVVGKHALKTVAETLAIEPKALAEQLRAGKTINEVAGSQAGAATQALTAEANSAIDKAVAAGKLPADKAAEAKAKAAERIEEFVSEAHVPGSEGHAKGPKPGRGPKTK